MQPIVDQLSNRFVGLTTTPKFVVADNWLGDPTQESISVFAETQKNGVNELFHVYYDKEFSGVDLKPVAYHKLIDLLNDCPWNVDILLKGISIIDAEDLRKEFATIKCPIIQGAQHMPFLTHLRVISSSDFRV